MITNNLKTLAAVLLQSATKNCGCLKLKDVNGRTWYTANDWYFPETPSTNLSKSAANAGISIGTGDAAATEEDYNLESTITSGVNLALSETIPGCDAPGNPYLLYKITVTNTGSAELTVREIGYKQTVKCVSAPGDTSVSTNKVCLLDRTVLDTPLVIQSGDAGVIYYKLRTDAAPSRTKSGVTLVSWEWGTDEQIAAMLDAADNGTIDLQSDGLWRVGDIRMVNIGAFTGGGTASSAAQTVGLVISSFEEYEGCGNVMQFDFFTALSGLTCRMNATATNVGGYAASEMRTVTLPALVEALPSWLKSRLKTFSVKASTGSGSTGVETVTGNKLALRSEVEINNTTNVSRAGEGSQAALYKDGSYRIKGGNYPAWWLRSAYSSNSFAYVTTAGATPMTASEYLSLAPFGCL